MKIEKLVLYRLEKKDYPRSKSIYLVLPNLDALVTPGTRSPSQLLILGAMATRRTETQTSIRKKNTETESQSLRNDLLPP